MFQRAATPLSVRSSSCVQHHRPFAAQQCKKRHQRAPASISTTTRRNVSASFSVSDITGPVNDTVNDLKSAEVRIRSPIICNSLRHHDSCRELLLLNCGLFVFVFCFFDRDAREKEEETRKTTTFFFFFNSSSSSRYQKRPRERKGEKKTDDDDDGDF